MALAIGDTVAVSVAVGVAVGVAVRGGLLLSVLGLVGGVGHVEGVDVRRDGERTIDSGLQQKAK